MTQDREPRPREFFVWHAEPPKDRRRSHRPITGPWVELERARESASKWARSDRATVVLDGDGEVWA